MYNLHTSIEISVPPEEVRAKFLDFSKLSIYHRDGFFKSLAPAVAGAPLEPGTKMHNVLEGMTIEPTILENSSSCFSWIGTGLLGTFSGEHLFRFERSKLAQGGTTFIHEENFTGLLSFIIGEGALAQSVGLRESTRKGFERYNEDLKRWCENCVSNT